MRLDKVVLVNDEAVSLGSFTVLVGGNGVGKSTLLRESFHQATAGPERVYRWLKSVNVTDPDPRRSAQLLLQSLDEVIDRNNPMNLTFQSRGSRRFGGDWDTSARLDLGTHKLLTDVAAGKNTGEFASNINIRKPFFSFHGPDTRLNVPHEVGLTPLDQPASDAVNVLWRKADMLRRVQRYISEAFKANIVLLDHRGAQLEFGVADSPSPEFPPHEDKQRRFREVEEWKRAQNFTPMTETGHGLRAMTNLLLSLFEPVNEILLIDEPELHLYPTQKRTLARRLVEIARDEKKQVVVVTHDATFLQGVLDAAADSTILRLQFGEVRSKRSIRQCSLAKDVGATKNQREYLNALFYERVILVEGAVDRTFYQGIAELARIGEGEDVGYVVGGGKGGTLNIAALCQKVGVPYAHVFDFDVLMPGDFATLEKAVAIRGSKIDLGALKKDIEGAISEIGKVASDEKKASKLLKASGLATKELESGMRGRLQAAVGELAKDGIFVVSNGELESWVPEAGEQKARFAERALEYVEGKAEAGKAVTEFLRHVYDWLVKAPTAPPPPQPAIPIRG